MDTSTWIVIIIVLILLGVLFYLRTKRQGEESEVAEEKTPITTKEPGQEEPK